MTNLTTSIDGPVGYLLPLGDVHMGSDSFGKEGRAKLKGYLEWAREHEDSAKIFLLGDIFDVATRQSKTSPYESSPNEYMEAITILEPYADLIVGAIDGNHEARMLDFAGISPTQHLCHALRVPYCKWSAILKFRVGKREAADSYRCTYYCYIHHTCGGGRYVLGRDSSVLRSLTELLPGADVYCGGHNHKLSAGSRNIYNTNGKQQRITYVSCGSYLEYNVTRTRNVGCTVLPKLGSPRIRLAGTDSKDVHVSL